MGLTRRQEQSVRDFAAMYLMPIEAVRFAAQSLVACGLKVNETNLYRECQ